MKTKRFAVKKKSSTNLNGLSRFFFCAVSARFFFTRLAIYLARRRPSTHLKPLSSAVQSKISGGQERLFLTISPFCNQSRQIAMRRGGQKKNCALPAFLLFFSCAQTKAIYLARRRPSTHLKPLSSAVQSKISGGNKRLFLTISPFCNQSRQIARKKKQKAAKLILYNFRRGKQKNNATFSLLSESASR